MHALALLEGEHRRTRVRERKAQPASMPTTACPPASLMLPTTACLPPHAYHRMPPSLSHAGFS